MSEGGLHLPKENRENCFHCLHNPICVLNISKQKVLIYVFVFGDLAFTI